MASYVLPAGQYDRQQDEATGREVVVAGTYHEVEPNPVAILATAGVRYEGWVKFAMPLYLLVASVGVVSVVVAIGIGLQ